MEALRGSQSLEGLIQSRKVAKWAGCSAKTFADAVVARLETLCETESYKADVLGRKAEVKAFYDRAVAANIHCLRGMEVQGCEEWQKLAAELGLTPDDVRKAGKPESLPANVSPCVWQSRVA